MLLVTYSKLELATIDGIYEEKTLTVWEKTSLQFLSRYFWP